METRYNFTGNELDIQKHIVENIKDICENCFFGDVDYCIENRKIQGKLKSGIIFDILVYHKNKTATLIEVKKYTSDMNLLSAIGQLLYYAEILKITLDNYPRLIIASNFIPNSLRATIKANNLPIRLLEVDGDKVTFI